MPWQRQCCNLDKCLHSPVHIVNALVTPSVHYESWQEFADLVYWVQDAFCVLVAEAVESELQTNHESHVIGSVFCCYMPTLETVKEKGPSIIMRLTKNDGYFWCKMVSHFVCCRALRAAAIFDDVRCSIGDTLEPLDTSLQHHQRVLLISNIMQQEIRHTFSGAMPFSIYTLCSGFVSTLLVKNFTFYNDQQLSAFPHKQFEEILLALCMGTHSRLGKHSCLLPLTPDILSLACTGLCASELEKHIAFHTQEQWLY